MGIYGNFDIEKDYFKQYSLAIIDESSFNDILKILKTRTANEMLAKQPQKIVEADNL